MNDPLAVIYNEGYWQVNEVSPMFDLQYSEKKLKQYALKIRRFIISYLAANADSKFTVSIENVPFLKYSDDDPNGLMITVKNRSTKKKSNKKVKYVAILLSWGTSIHINHESTHLPYMLEHGYKYIGVVVKNALRTTFDCTITPFSFTKTQLLEFMFHFIYYDTSRSTGNFVLRYKTSAVNFKHKTSFTFKMGNIRKIWASNQKINVVKDKAKYLYSTIQDIIYDRFTVKVEFMHLCEVVLPKAEVKDSGIVKMKTSDIINAVFTVLNKITFEKFKLVCRENEEETG